VGGRAFDDFLEYYRWRFGTEDPSILDWTRTMRVRPRITDAPVRDVRPNAPARNTVIFGPAGRAEILSHPDRSVDIVVLDEGPSAATLAEARRVARNAIVVWARDEADEPLTLEWLRDRDVRRPDVSVLVHTGNTGDRLDACLRSIFETTPVVGAIEIVVADAAATEEAAGVARAWSQRRDLRYVRAEPAQGSIAACNLGADAARGELLVFLSDHTLALPGWLRPLVRTLRDEPDVGAVGGKLLSDNGRLKQAGGLIFADGSLASFGRGALDPEAPVYGFVRDVHYVSADLLATRAGLFRRLGGIDSLFHSGGYDDVDYCFRVRAAGRRVVYQPQSVVLGRVEPAAAPTRDNRDRFIRRWASALASLPQPPEYFDDATWDRLAWVA
jgi:GT2 family glycosyltransferase